MIREKTMLSGKSSFKRHIDILTEIKNGEILPTRIMYKTAISWNILRKMLENLTAQGIIEKKTPEGNKRSKNNYTITKKGNTALNYLNKINELMNPQKTIKPPTTVTTTLDHIVENTEPLWRR